MEKGQLLTYIGHSHGISSCNYNFSSAFTELNMPHTIISLKGPRTKCVTLTTKCFASAVAQDHVLAV